MGVNMMSAGSSKFWNHRCVRCSPWKLASPCFYWRFVMKQMNWKKVDLAVIIPQVLSLEMLMFSFKTSCSYLLSSKILVWRLLFASVSKRLRRLQSISMLVEEWSEKSGGTWHVAIYSSSYIVLNKNMSSKEVEEEFSLCFHSFPISQIIRV